MARNFCVIVFTVLAFYHEVWHPRHVSSFLTKHNAYHTVNLKVVNPICPVRDRHTDENSTHLVIGSMPPTGDHCGLGIPLFNGPAFTGKKWWEQIGLPSVLLFLLWIARFSLHAYVPCWYASEPHVTNTGNWVTVALFIHFFTELLWLYIALMVCYNNHEWAINKALWPSPDKYKALAHPNIALEPHDAIVGERIAVMSVPVIVHCVANQFVGFQAILLKVFHHESFHNQQFAYIALLRSVDNMRHVRELITALFLFTCFISLCGILAAANKASDAVRVTARRAVQNVASVFPRSRSSPAGEEATRPRNRRRPT